MKRCLLLPILALCALPAQAVFLDCLMNDGFQNEIGATPANWKSHLALNNCARKTVIPAASPALANLSWNTTLATQAQNYANNCNYVHSGAPNVGENLYAGAVSSGFPSNVEIAAAQNWAGEFPNYNYATMGCTGQCGHYTQMVWRSTSSVGCGIRNCTTNSPFQPPFTNWTLVVCQYSPAGNFSGQRPY